MHINEEILRLLNIPAITYINWCKMNKFKPSLETSKAKFFDEIKHGRIYRDKETGKITYRGVDLVEKVQTSKKTNCD